MGQLYRARPICIGVFISHHCIRLKVRRLLKTSAQKVFSWRLLNVNFLASRVDRTFDPCVLSLFRGLSSCFEHFHLLCTIFISDDTYLLILGMVRFEILFWLILGTVYSSHLGLISEVRSWLWRYISWVVPLFLKTRANLTIRFHILRRRSRGWCMTCLVDSYIVLVNYLCVRNVFHRA
jgi:hypothetical protein